MGLPEITLTGTRKFNPRTLGGCCLWIHADAYLHDGSGNVTVMLDQSGLNNDLYQLTPAQQVTVQNSIFFDGKPVFRFGDALRYYERIGINAIRGFPYGPNPSTTFVVFSRSVIPDANGFETMFYWQKGSGTPDIMLSTDSNGLFLSASQDNLTGWLSVDAVNTACIFGAQFQNSSMFHFKNGIPGESTNATGNFGGPTNPRIRIGNALETTNPTVFDRGFQGSLAEVIVFNRFLAPEERAEVFNQLGGYYDIPIAASWGGILG